MTDGNRTPRPASSARGGTPAAAPAAPGRPAFLLQLVRLDQQKPRARRQVAGEMLAVRARRREHRDRGRSSVARLRCVATSKRRIDSTSSPNSSIRTGSSSRARRCRGCRRGARTRRAARRRWWHGSRGSTSQRVSSCSSICRRRGFRAWRQPARRAPAPAAAGSGCW